MELSHLAIDPADAVPNDFASVARSGIVRFAGYAGPVRWILWRSGTVTFTVDNLSPFSVLTTEHRARTDYPGCLDPTWISRAYALRANCTAAPARPLPNNPEPRP